MEGNEGVEVAVGVGVGTPLGQYQIVSAQVLLETGSAWINMPSMTLPLVKKLCFM